ncbi:MAG: DUF4229 domain-containing protein [Nocardiopsaceae bacterium]|nr:DUF4229 domain-containing protein [Nocardiopsaceae bacterium]
MRSVLAYTVSRLLLFAVAFGVLYLVGARGFLAIALALLVSGLVSYVLLSAQRDAMSAVIAEGITRMRGMGERLEAGAAKEDAAQTTAAADPGNGLGAPEDEAADDGARGSTANRESDSAV